MQTIALSINTPSLTRTRTTRTRTTRRIASRRSLLLLVVALVLLFALWSFGAFTFPEAVTGSSSFTGCPSVSIHC